MIYPLSPLFAPLPSLSYSLALSSHTDLFAVPPQGQAGPCLRTQKPPVPLPGMLLPQMMQGFTSLFVQISLQWGLSWSHYVKLQLPPSLPISGPTTFFPPALSPFKITWFVYLSCILYISSHWNVSSISQGFVLFCIVTYPHFLGEYLASIILCSINIGPIN